MTSNVIFNKGAGTFRPPQTSDARRGHVPHRQVSFFREDNLDGGAEAQLLVLRRVGGGVLGADSGELLRAPRLAQTLQRPRRPAGRRPRRRPIPSGEGDAPPPRLQRPALQGKRLPDLHRRKIHAEPARGKDALAFRGT